MPTSPRRTRPSLIAILLGVLVVLALGMRAVRQGMVSTLAEGQGISGPHVYEFPIFGTYGRLSFWGPEDLAEETTDEVVERLQSIHDMSNLFADDSELSRLNATAREEPFVCSDRLWELLGECRRAHQETDGAFDISVGPLMKLWGFHRKRTTLPTEAEIEAARAAVGLENVLFGELTKTVLFRHPDTYLDLGGVVKGYALDQVAEIARKRGIRTGMIDLGGNIFCLNEPPPGKHAYNIGVRNPFDNDALLETVGITNCAVATSGNYEQFVEVEGKRIHHIIDPRTGYPAEDVAGVTVITPRGIDSDVFSTAIFVEGEKLVHHLRCTRRRTSVLRVLLETDGRESIRRYGWIWD
ncbi:MAG: FAD:protein FMN transferase [Lentisphaerae bacterium]|nr:FAD:protein FMN transferase [Lentisphaerota bacterium]MBT5610559.1 FAD:protein FMN transferase [Lentisphaerota bacterium]MBT7054431.1 FAD:protein FMN transferase [Lentisphaerota bacterium]MBT7842600.1 FAD:protein FMN transferase [Lentisphaerota bacterium]